MVRVEALESRYLCTVSAPINVQALFLANSFVKVTWQDQASNESGFRVEYSYNNGASWINLRSQYTFPASSGSDSFLNNLQIVDGNYIDRLPDQTKDYRIRVVAFNSTEEAASSNNPIILSGKSRQIQLTATVNSSTGTITLNWPAVPNATSYKIYRSTDLSAGYGSSPLATQSGTSYADSAVASGTMYHYMVTTVDPSTDPRGFVSAGIAVGAVVYRGRVLVVESLTSTQRADLQGEVDRLKQDLVGDGWQVVSISKTLNNADITATTSPVDVKAAIQSAYDDDASHAKQVLLAGKALWAATF
jgi:hypothetical protein